MLTYYYMLMTLLYILLMRIHIMHVILCKDVLRQNVTGVHLTN